MFVRPLARRPIGRGGLLGTAARTAVVAGTATAVVGGMQRHQQARAEEAADAEAYRAQQEAQQQAAYAPPPPPPQPAADDEIAQLQKLAELKQQGLLSDEEFAAAKARLLGI